MKFKTQATPWTLLKIVTTILIVTISTNGFAEEDSCFENLKSRICYVDKDLLPDTEFRSFIQSNIEHMQTCSQAPELHFIHELENSFDQLPETYQKLMCSLKKIIIFAKENPVWAGSISGYFEKESLSITPVADETGLFQISADATGLIMQLHEDTFRETMNEAKARHMGKLFSDPKNITHHWEVQGPSLRLSYNLVHEISHVLDNYNGVCPCNPWADADCSSLTIQGQALPGTYANFSWRYDFMQNRLVHRDYSVDTFLDHMVGQGPPILYDNTFELFTALKESDFSSFYASANCSEDFAELMTAQVMKSSFNASKLLVSNSDSARVFDFYAERPETAAKVTFVEEKLLKNPNLRLTPQLHKLRVHTRRTEED